MASTFDDIDGMNVVGIDDTGAAKTAHDLGEDVGGDLAPGEVTESGESDCDRRVNVSARDAARDGPSSWGMGLHRPVDAWSDACDGGCLAMFGLIIHPSLPSDWTDTGNPFLDAVID